jgi:hypothetical protein
MVIHGGGGSVYGCWGHGGGTDAGYSYRIVEVPSFITMTGVVIFGPDKIFRVKTIRV